SPSPRVTGGVSGCVRASKNEGVTGILVPGHDPVDYARELRRFVDDPGLADRMGGEAARHAQFFGWDTAAAGTADVYTAAMLDHRRRVRSHHG
ncbi:D-inositol-3-phosphate glycosyltransferase, partial [Streptomyces goshikiensis]